MALGVLSHQREPRREIFQVMQTKYGESMQRFQFSRRLALFCQSRMREQRANVMGYSAEQIAIIRSIGFAMKLLPQARRMP